MNIKIDTFQSTAFHLPVCIQRILQGGFIAMLLLLFTPATQAQGQAQGIALWKRTASHPTTHFFEYREINHQGQVTRLRLVGGGSRELTMFQLVGHVDYFQMPPTISPDSGTQAFSTHLAQYRQILSQCPEAARVLRPRIDELEDAGRRMVRGEVRYNGGWISRDAYERQLAAAADRERREQLERNKPEKKTIEEQPTEIPLPSPEYIRHIRREQENKRRRTE